MWVVTLAAFERLHVLARRDARHGTPVAVRVTEVGVTAQAKLPARINIQSRHADRMIDTRTVTVFTLDGRMYRTFDSSGVFYMAHGTVVPALVLDRNVFPVLQAAETIIAVSETPAVHAKVVWDQESPTEDD
jgi:hypothetical protein